MFIVAGGIVAALAVFSAPASPVEAAGQCSNPYAAEVVSYTLGRNHIESNAPQNALDRPEGGGQKDSAPNFASLGVGYSLTVKMAENILNGPGPDVRVYETTYGVHIPESAQVFASQDGNNFMFLGNATNLPRPSDTTITDLDLGSLEWARYLKIVDTTTASLPGADVQTEAFDVDGLEAINCGSVATPTPTPRLPQCSDFIDNDGDGKIDYPADLGCESPQDDDERDKPECSDGKDNDGDGLVDADDPGCHTNSDLTKKYNPDDDDERNGQCSDKKDNDKDGKIDRKDSDCHTDGNPDNDDSFDGDRDETTKVKAAIVKKAQITPVAITAKTGAGMGSLMLTLVGAAGLALTRRFST